jgi:exonuclease III
MGHFLKVSMDRDNILFWNVCGLGGGGHRHVVANMVRQQCIFVVCLQETKLSVIDDTMIYDMFGRDFSYSFVPTVGRCGDITVAWRSSVWSTTNIHASTHALTLRLSQLTISNPWWPTVVYGPQ